MRTARALILLSLAAGGCLAPRDEAAKGEAGPRDRRLADRQFLDRDFSIPADTELIRQIEKAVDLRLRREYDQFLDATEPGELLEHATLTQVELDRSRLKLDGIFLVGDERFDYEFRPENGLGNGLRDRPGIAAGRGPAPNLRRVHQGEFGGPDSDSCASCHRKGGLDGAGNNTQNAFLRGDGRSTLTADVRNPPHVLGLGPVEALAREMTAELRAEREKAVAEAREKGQAVDAPLDAKGVRFGVLRALPDGTVDAGGVEGIDPDLVVKPFGWKGHSATLRDIIEESFRIHMGLVSMRDQERVRDGQAPRGDYGDGVWYDVDRDGATLEIDEGVLTTMVVYLAQLETPVIRPPRSERLLDAFARGQVFFREARCDSCHRPLLVLHDPVLEVRPRGAGAAGKEPIRVNVAEDGDLPKIEPQNAGRAAFNVRLFSDLKRHDMGPALSTPTVQAGIPRTVFLTRSLWGLATTAPYLHDGRAPTIDDAIRLHGGEAAASRDAYLAADEDARVALQVFLLSLTREPKLLIP